MTIKQAIQTHNPSQDLATFDTPFASVVSLVVKTVVKSSARVYCQTYAAWEMWCLVNGIEPMDIRATHVYEFLESKDTTLATRNRQLSAMRQFARVLIVLDGQEAQRLYEGLKLIKAPKPSYEVTISKERTKTALSPSQADKLIRVWSGDDNLSKRNRAMIRLLIFTGLRRSELLALTWDDINFDTRVIQVRHGKGNKRREVAIMDSTDNTLAALKAWRDIVPDYRTIFIAVNKAGALKADKPITAKTIYRVVQATAKIADLPNIAPHDLRRTHITEYATTGTLSGAQAQAGHAHSSTTLGYAQAVDASNRRHDAKFRFGA